LALSFLENFEDAFLDLGLLLEIFLLSILYLAGWTQIWRDEHSNFFEVVFYSFIGYLDVNGFVGG
jgi:hypothetical protein